MLWGNFTNALVLYVNALILYPYRKRLWLPYWLCALLLIAGTAIVEALVDYQLVYYLELDYKLDAVFNGDNYLYIVAYFIRNFFTHLLWYIFSFTIVFVYESKKNQRIQKALKAEKLKAELKFLRAQINPHFLFNGINSVYFLIDEKPDIAKSTLLKFSDLLRYQLYECQDEWIPLAKEVAHVEAYIDMEKIRRGKDISIQLNVPEYLDSYNISPLLFTPFLENAFKYVSNKDDGKMNQINILISLKEEELFFEIENTIDENNTHEQGGIGIKNVRKRLELIYPKKHQLDIFEKDNWFMVKMKISLAE